MLAKKVSTFSRPNLCKWRGFTGWASINISQTSTFHNRHYNRNRGLTHSDLQHTHNTQILILMEPNIYQLALAALFGASFVAVSGFFMHFKALNLVLERGKERKENPDGDDSQNQTLVRRRSQVRRKGNDQYGRSPASIPDSTPFSDGGGGGGSGSGDAGRSNGHVYVDEIPPGLPRLHTPSEGTKTGLIRLDFGYRLSSVVKV